MILNLKFGCSWSWSGCWLVLRRQFNEQECCTKETTEVLVIHISLCHISEIISLCIEALIPLIVFLPFSQFTISSSVGRCVSSRGSRLEAEGFCGMQGPAPGLDQSALQWFLPFGVCVFPEKLLVCRLHPVLFLKHTHAHTEMYSEHKCMWAG